MIKKYVYLIKSSDDIYKIGVSSNVNKRLKQLQTGCSEQLILIDQFLSSYPFKIESTLHRLYKRYRISGEWYQLDSEHVNNFQSNCLILENSLNALEITEFII